MPAPENLNIQQPGEAPAQQAADTPETQAAPTFKAAHKGAGRYVVLDATGNQVGDFIGTKEEAEAEALRLAGGGEPFIKSDDTDEIDAPAQQMATSTAATETIDPRKLAKPVLTADGWLVPEQ